MKEKEVYDYLCENHLGKENMIKNKDLRKIFGINSDKSMRQVIQNIRESSEYPKLVGSISGIKGGFFICTTQDEIKETIDNTKHRANQMYKLCHVMEWKAGISNEIFF